jgi:hypothetical protein
MNRDLALQIASALCVSVLTSVLQSNITLHGIKVEMKYFRRDIDNNTLQIAKVGETCLQKPVAVVSR